MENKAENRTENKIYKATLDFGGGREHEISGESIMVFGLTHAGAAWTWIAM